MASLCVWLHILQAVHAPCVLVFQTLFDGASEFLLVKVLVVFWNESTSAAWGNLIFSPVYVAAEKLLSNQSSMLYLRHSSVVSPYALILVDALLFMEFWDKIGPLEITCLFFVPSPPHEWMFSLWELMSIAEYHSATLKKHGTLPCIYI